MQFVFAFALILFASWSATAAADRCPTYKKVIASSPWVTNFAEVNMVIGLRGADDPSFAVEMAFCSGDKLLLAVKPDAHFVGIIHTGDVSPRIVTVWISGNGTYRVKVFSHTTAGVSMVFEANSNMMPELILPKDLSRSDEPFLLLSSIPERRNEQWSPFADIYLWSDGVYKKLGTVKWEDRLSHLPY